MKKLNIKKFLNRCSKGFTVAEVMVAMAVVAVISVATLRVIQRSNEVNQKSANYAEARQIANNVIEVFKYTDTYTPESEDSLYDKNMYYYLTRTAKFGLSFTCTSTDYKQYMLTDVQNYYRMYVVLSQDPTTHRWKIDITCYGSSNTELFQMSYEKGDVYDS